MCLFTTNTNPITSDKEVTCYKVLLKDKEGNLITPYTETKVDVLQPFVADKFGEYSQTYNDNLFSVCHGIHTYTTDYDVIDILCDVIDSFCYFVDFDEHKPVIYECIIPKGIKYFKGIENDYCSERIKFVREISNEEMKVMFQKVCEKI